MGFGISSITSGFSSVVHGIGSGAKAVANKVESGAEAAVIHPIENLGVKGWATIGIIVTAPISIPTLLALEMVSGIGQALGIPGAAKIDLIERIYGPEVARWTKLAGSIILLAVSIILCVLFPPAGAFGVGVAIAGIGASATMTGKQTYDTVTYEEPASAKAPEPTTQTTPATTTSRGTGRGYTSFVQGGGGGNGVASQASAPAPGKSYNTFVEGNGGGSSQGSTNGSYVSFVHA